MHLMSWLRRAMDIRPTTEVRHAFLFDGRQGKLHLARAMKKLMHAGSFICLVLGGACALSGCDRKPAGTVAAAPAVAEKLTATGEIFGLTIGSKMEEARKKLEPMRDLTNHVADAKEISGRRIYWKLRGSEYDWIMAWADGAGKITRMRAVYRSESPVPFEKIGDLQTALAVSDTTVKWDLRRPDGGSYRLIAQGADRRAKTVYMFSTDLPAEGQPTGETEEEEED